MLVTLGAEDWPLWKEARLAALTDSAEAFPNAAAEWLEGGEQRWRDRLLDETALKIVAIGVDQAPIGLVRGYVKTGIPGTPLAKRGRELVMEKVLGETLVQ